MMTSGFSVPSLRLPRLVGCLLLLFWAASLAACGDKGNLEPPMKSVTGFIVTPSMGPTIVTGIALTAADDAPERDPFNFMLECSNDGSTYELIAEGPVAAFPSRVDRQVIHFGNTKRFTS